MKIRKVGRVLVHRYVITDEPLSIRFITQQEEHRVHLKNSLKQECILYEYKILAAISKLTL